MTIEAPLITALQTKPLLVINSHHVLCCIKLIKGDLMSCKISATGSLHIQAGSVYFNAGTIISSTDLTISATRICLIGRKYSILPTKALLKIVSYLNIKRHFFNEIIEVVE